MLNWIRWWGLAAFAVLMVIISLLWFLLAPWLVKNSIEELGSEAVGAMVEVDSVSLSLFPAGISLSNLQIADPDAPMKNLFQTDKINVKIEPGPLFWKKIVVDDLSISQVRMGSVRDHSGALKGGRKTSQMMDKIAAFKLPETKDINVKEMVDKANLLTLERLNKLKQMQKEMQQHWKKALNKKELSNNLKTLKSEFNQLQARAKKNKFNLLKDAKKWKKLKKKISAERKKYTELKKKLSLDKKALQKQLALVKKGLADDLRQLMDQVGLGDGSVEGLSKKFLGPKLTPWISRGLALFQNMNMTSATGTKQPTVNYSRKYGKKVFFKDRQPLPDYLLKKLQINGNDSAWALDGKGSDIAFPPWQWSQPAKLSGHLVQLANGENSGKGVSKNLKIANKAGKADFKFYWHWPTEHQMDSKVNMSIQHWRLSHMPLMSVEGGDWVINQGDLSAKLGGRITLEKLNINLVLNIRSPVLSFPENLKDWQKQMASSINQQPEITAKIQVTGSLQDPEIKIKSGLEKIFQNMLKARLQKETAKIKNKMKDALTAKIGDLSNIGNIGQQLSGWQQQLNVGDKGLSDILKGIKF